MPRQSPAGAFVAALRQRHRLAAVEREKRPFALMPSATPLSRQSQLAASRTENLIDDEPQLITSTTGNSVMLYSAWPEPD